MQDLKKIKTREIFFSTHNTKYYDQFQHYENEIYYEINHPDHRMSWSIYTFYNMLCDYFSKKEINMFLAENQEIIAAKIIREDLC